MNSQAILRLAENYKIENKIGSGGMGDIYLALDKRLERYVAIKVLNFTQVNLNEKDEFVNRFKSEAKAIARLNHHNIVGIYDFGESDNFYYIVMEYVDGKSLSTIIKNVKTKIPLKLIASIFYQTASALEYAHENNIIHRDVKPDNILLSRKGLVKLTDFGIAKFNEQVSKIDENNYLVGSILYSSPEQIKNSTNVDFRTDIYSLGVTIYELIAGQPPFSNSKDTKDLIHKIFYNNPEDLTIYYPEININFYSIVKKMFRKKSSRQISKYERIKKRFKTFCK
ncbi:MAG: hypothetical protein KatS3mg068_1169 [Candidatus Sericytochromatia bacterium]|nr:MAG: hypothetical protein KatS3mg068_1169 [Candidatus Sericytochromatia bacterium]